MFESVNPFLGLNDLLKMKNHHGALLTIQALQEMVCRLLCMLRNVDAIGIKGDYDGLVRSKLAIFLMLQFLQTDISIEIVSLR